MVYKTPLHSLNMEYRMKQGKLVLIHPCCLIMFHEIPAPHLFSEDKMLQLISVRTGSSVCSLLSIIIVIPDLKA